MTRREDDDDVVEHGLVLQALACGYVPAGEEFRIEQTQDADGTVHMRVRSWEELEALGLVERLKPPVVY